MAAIEECLILYRKTGIAENLVIYGESGTGKTSLCYMLQQKYPRTSVIERDIIPVLYVPIPAGATIGGITEALLSKLGDPSPSSGRISAQTARAIKLVRACGVELMLFDEGQQLQDRGKLPSQYRAGDHLKTIIDQAARPAVLLGLPRIENLVQVNDQLRRRFTRRINMALGQDAATPFNDECLQLFANLAPALPVPFTYGEYSPNEFGYRLYAATDGRVAYVKILLSTAIRLVFQESLREISPSVLATAFTLRIWSAGIGPLNPFDEQFEFRPLHRVGEPFEPSSPDKTGRRARRNLDD